LKPTSAASVLN